MDFKESASDPQVSCFVSGTLAKVLRVSRFIGLAPLTFVRKRTGWRVCLSSRFNIYGCILVTIINIFIIAALVEDLSLEREKSFRLRTNTRRIVWTTDACILMLLASTAVYGSSGKMKSMITCLNRLQKINYELNIFHWPNWFEGKKMIIVVSWMALVVVLSTVDNILLTMEFIIQSTNPTQSIRISGMYTFYYSCYWILQLQEIQFTLITLHVLYTFKTINANMRGLLNEYKLSSLFNQTSNGNKISKRLSTNSVDCVTIEIKTDSDELRKTHHIKVRSLSYAYTSICDVVREVDRSYGLLLLIMVGSWLYHLVITPYYLINNLFANNPEHNGFYVVIQLLWCVLHAASLILVIEPCHMTHMEMDTTRELVSHVMCVQQSSYEPLAVELDQFFRHLLLTQASYSPLRVTTMSRALVATVFGSITTYLVVIIQL